MQVVPGVLSLVQRVARDRAELVLGQQRRSFVVQAPSVGGDLVEPDVVGAAAVGLGEEQDRGGDPGVGLEDPARQL